MGGPWRGLGARDPSPLPRPITYENGLRGHGRAEGVARFGACTMASGAGARGVRRNAARHMLM